MATEMTTTWRAISAALELALLDNKKSIPAETDWRDVFDECKAQSIAGLIFPVITDHLPDDLKAEWKTYNLKMVAANARLLYEQNQLRLLLKDYPFCILKGTAAAIYYPTPELRSMGDIDFIVSEKCFDDVKGLLIRNGYAPSEEDNPRHIAFRKNGILFEMHHYFHSGHVGIDQCIDRCWDRLSVGKVGGCVFPMLPEAENGLTLLEHVRQHLYEGLGIRQVLDWMMFVRTYLTDEHWRGGFEADARALGLHKLAIVTTRMCQLYLGLSEDITWCSDADPKLCARLMDNIIRSGNFGVNHGNGQAVEKTIIRLRKHGLLRYIQQAGEFNWAAYHRHPWLKPFAWAYQIGRYARQLIAAGRKGAALHDDILRSNQRYELLRELDL